MRKKMIEVAIPLDAINRESAREKSIRHGHPSTLHLWWARRPLAACRAVLFASLVDDPDSDPGNLNPDGSLNQRKAQARRAELFALIEELVKWDNSSNAAVLNRARAEIAASVAITKVHDTHQWQPEQVVCGEPVAHFLARSALPDHVNQLLCEHAPPVLDPFCGGGSIPLEAQRLGLRAYASDLNPIPVLINKALIELPARFSGCPPVAAETQGGNSRSQAKSSRQKTFASRTWTGAEGIAADVRFFGKWMRDEAGKQLDRLYPKVLISKDLAKGRPDLEPYVGQELVPIAWLWARTVPSPNPAASGIHVPLTKSFWLSTKKGRTAWVEPILAKDRKSYSFRVRTGVPSPEEKSAADAGTKLSRGCNFRCLLSDTPISEEHIKESARAGLLGTRLMAIVADTPTGRVYISPTMLHEESPDCTDLERLVAGLDVPLANDPRNLWCLKYGLDRFAKLFTPRQLVALSVFSDAVLAAREEVLRRAKEAGMSAAEDYADAIAHYLAFAQSKACNRNTSLCIWETSMDRLVATFGRQAIPMVWDFAETNPLAGAGGDFYGTVESVAEVLDRLVFDANKHSGARQHSAVNPHVYAEKVVVSTDPPYYDNIGYADLSDFFYVWLRRSLGQQYPSLFTTLATPKAEEVIAATHRHEGSRDRAHSFFEAELGKAFGTMRAAGCAEYPMTVYYAFKQSEADSSGDVDETLASTGWETMLEGLITADLAITGTWPMRTEQPKGLRAYQQNALASSIVLVCRPRPIDAPITSRRDFTLALKRELPSALKELQGGNVAPVDLAQAAIGPGMAIYTRYSKVLESSGERLPVRTALALINQVLDEVLAEQEGDYDADTRWSLKWFEQFAHDDGPFGDANTLATAMSIGINGLVETGIVQAKAGKVRLLKRTELMGGHPETWDPATDTDIVHWEVCQYLIHALDTKGEAGAAALLRRINARYPGASETARELAYRLYTICERKKWAQEAMAYNSLIVAWPEIVKLAQSSDGSGGEAQTTLF
jgi:putative DNA methylase